MNLDRSRSLDLIKTIKGRIGDGNDREVAIFAPSIYLADVGAVAQGSPLGIGGQNLWYENSGAFTGELSSPMLREVGADRVLVGHSERRHVFRELDEWMGRKMRAALDGDLMPIYCIGETLDERKANRTDRVLKKQLEAGLGQLKEEDAHRVCVAYEPVWAIGTGKTATPEQAQDVHRYIRSVLAQHDPSVAEKVQILYGGSVKGDNAAGLFGMPDIDGGLIGGASLKAADFLAIARAATEI
jgi:triosephosphate isomerase